MNLAVFLIIWCQKKVFSAVFGVAFFYSSSSQLLLLLKIAKLEAIFLSSFLVDLKSHSLLCIIWVKPNPQLKMSGDFEYKSVSVFNLLYIKGHQEVSLSNNVKHLERIVISDVC